MKDNNSFHKPRLFFSQIRGIPRFLKHVPTLPWRLPLVKHRHDLLISLRQTGGAEVDQKDT
ncbi:MAG: hypothetical protein AMJ61_09395 [Desulfobacterales bacterium SG8_35_2]|nr:MAG: hypothetical protein AMJ61_09395 [Desulfobacterales bacterium SG8_35_2]